MPDAAFVPAPGPGGLPRLLLRAADGARAQVYVHGAHVTSWVPAGDTQDRLYLSARARYADGEAIRGGVPVCFPQFADQGGLPMHGFVRTTAWQVARAAVRADGAAEAVLRFAASDATRALWPHGFALEYTVTVAAQTLSLRLCVVNAGTAEFTFTAALHTYLRVRDVRAARVRGLAGAHYRDKVQGLPDVVETGADLAITGFTDRVYRAAPADLAVVEPGRTLGIRTSGFFDTVIWNPDAERCAKSPDMAPGDWRSLLCVEAAAAHRPVLLPAGASWQGAQVLTAA